MPVPAPMVATEGELLLHDPLPDVSVSVAEEPIHSEVGPVIKPASGNGLMVMTLEAVAVPQLLVTAYRMVSTPAARPETTPVLLTVATEV